MLKQKSLRVYLGDYDMSFYATKVSVSKLIVFFGLFAFFRPNIFERLDLTNTLFNGLLVVSFILATLDYFIRRNKLKGLFILFVSLFYLIMIYSTVINRGSYSRMFMYAAVGFCTVVFVMYMIKYEFYFATKVMRVFMWLYVLINIASIIAFPHGITVTDRSSSPVYFLGQDTRFAYFYLPGLLFCYLGDEYKKGRISVNTIVLYAICLASLITAWSVGSAIALLLFLLFFLSGKRKIFLPIAYYIVQFSSYLGLTFFSIIRYFSGFITGFLGKDLTLNSRTAIWSRALRLISQTPLFGIGVPDNLTMTNSLGFVHTHNHLLQVTLQCGYIGFALFMALLLVSYLRLREYKDFEVAKVIAFFLFMIGIQLLVDTVDGVRNHYIFMIAIGASIGELYNLFQRNANIKNEVKSDADWYTHPS